jgi:hypothetical protein
MPNNAELSEPMLQAMQTAAQESGKDVNSLLNGAVEQYLSHRGVDELAAYRQANSRRLGRVPSDAVRFVREDRNNQNRGQ